MSEPGRFSCWSPEPEPSTPPTVVQGDPGEALRQSWTLSFPVSAVNRFPLTSNSTRVGWYSSASPLPAVPVPTVVQFSGDCRALLHMVVVSVGDHKISSGTHEQDGARRESNCHGLRRQVRIGAASSTVAKRGTVHLGLSSALLCETREMENDGVEPHTEKR